MEGWFGLSLEVVFACVYGMFVREDWRYGVGMTSHSKGYVCGLRDELMYSQWRLREAECPAENCIFTFIDKKYSPVVHVGYQAIVGANAVTGSGITLIP